MKQAGASGQDDHAVIRAMVQAMNRTLRDAIGGSQIERFDLIVEILFLKMLDERQPSGGQQSHMQRNMDGPNAIASIKALWKHALKKYPFLPVQNRPVFLRHPDAILPLLKVLGDYCLSDIADDVKGRAYEQLLNNTFEKTDNQQFFTPHNIVKFMVELAQPKERMRICDPACGSGGFLIEAWAHLLQQGSSPGSLDIVGVDVDPRMVWVTQVNLLMHGYDRQAIFHLNGDGSLGPWEEVGHLLEPDSFDLVLTNPPFGSDFTNASSLANFRTGRGRKSRRRSVLFTERCVDLLAPGGVLGIVLDDSVLNQAANCDVRQLLLERGQVESVVSLPEVTFMPYSTAKSSIVVFRKLGSGRRAHHVTVFAEAREVGRKANGDALFGDDRDVDGRQILLSDLPDIATVLKSSDFADGTVAYGSRSQEPLAFGRDLCRRATDDETGRLDILFHHPSREVAERDLARSQFPVVSLGELVHTCRASLVPAVELPGATVRWIGLGDVTPHSGEYQVQEILGDNIKSTALRFAAGDVLFSKLRPNLRKSVRVALSDEGGICSSEFLILKPIEQVAHPSGTLRVDADYVSRMLRTELIAGQLMCRITGVGRPRVAARDVLSVRMPIPPLEVQREIVSEIQEAEASVVTANKQASALVNDAQRDLHDALRGVSRMMTKETAA